MKKNYKKMRKKEEHLVSLIYRPITEQIAKFLFKTNITPNQITTFGIFISIIAGIFFSLGEWKYLIIGAILAQCVLITDLLDGQVARYKKLRTMFGRWYDKIANKIFKYIMFLGATIGAYRVSGDYMILIVGIIAIFNVTMISFVSLVKHFYDFSKNYSELPKTKKYFIPFGMITVVGLSISALLNILSWYLWFFAIFGTFAWIKQIFSHYRLGKDIKIKD